MPRLDAEGPVGLVAGFDEGLTADAAGGDPRPGHHDALRADAEGHAGRGVRLRPWEFLRYGVPGNLSLEEGTLTLWVRPDAAVTPGTAAAGPERQQLFAIDDRLGLRLAAELNHEDPAKPYVLVQAGAGGRKYRFGVPVDSWPAGVWRRVQVAWKRPATAAVRLDDGPWTERTEVPLPGIPDAMAMDLYLGSNAVQLKRSPVGKPFFFEGVLDGLVVGPRYRDGSAPAGLVDPRRRANALPLAWAADGPVRVQLDLAGGADPAADLRRPVRARIAFGDAWAAHTPAQRRAALRSLCVVRQDPETGEAVARPGGGVAHPFRLHEDAYSNPEVDLRFVHRGPLPARYAVYADPAAPEATRAEPAEAVSVGNGDRLLVGRPGAAATLNGGLRGNHEAFDPDGDGDTDFWLAYADQIGAGDDLSNGHFFYENVGGPGHDAVYAPPVLIRRGHTPVGNVKATMAPQLVDVNGDGKTDCFLYGGGSTPTQWWEWSFENGRVVIDAVHELGLPEIGKAERGLLLDWNGDGRMDLLAGNEVRYGRQAAGEPLEVDQRADLTLDVGSIPADGWQSSPLSLLPLDWDGDGVRDLLASGWQTRLFVHRGKRGGGGTVFGEGERLVTFDGHELAMPSVFPVPRVVDLDNDGDSDLTWTNEGAMLGWCENIAAPGEAPMLRQTVFFRQVDAPVNANAIAVAAVHDWDGDGDGDLVLGTSAAGVYLSENVGDAEAPVWDESRFVEAAGRPIELRSGERGSLLGPQESDWGYTNPVVADWDGDGLDDLLVSGIRGEVHFFRNQGEPGRPSLASGRRIEFSHDVADPPYPAWTRFPRQGRELIIAHRCRPAVWDWNGDGQLDLLTLDHESRWAVYPGRRDPGGGVPTVGLPIHDAFELDDPYALAQIWNRRPLDHPGWRPHYAGRTVAELTDWDGDGDPDLILDSVNARYHENVSGDPADPATGRVRFVDRGEMASARLVKHNTGPGTGDLTGDGRADLLVGAQSGRVFFFSREFLEGASPRVRVSRPEERLDR